MNQGNLLSSSALMIASAITTLVLVVGGICILTNGSSSTGKQTKSKNTSKTGVSKIKTSKGSKIDDENDDDESDEEVLRGYKKTSTGRTTSYFHRELSAEELKIIGDNTPKRIDPGSSSVKDDSPRKIVNSSGSLSPSGSVWNAAGTFEERVVTSWANEVIRESLMSINVEPLPTEKFKRLTVKNIQNIQGEATVNVVRGKKRYIYDYSLEVTWTLQSALSPSDSVDGVIVISDISADAHYEITHRYSTQYNKLNPESKRIVDSIIKSKDSGLLPAIKEALNRVFIKFQESF